MYIYALSIFLTSTAFVSTNTKYGIPLLRYTIFLKNCPLGYAPKITLLFLCLVHAKIIDGVVEGNVAHNSTDNVHVRSHLTVFHHGAKVIAQDAAEVVVARIGQE